MSSKELYIWHKNLFDELIEKFGCTLQRVNDFIEIIAEDIIDFTVDLYHAHVINLTERNILIRMI